MENSEGNRNALNVVIHWTARISSIISLGLIVAFIVGEGFDPTTIKPIEWAGFLLFPFGISVGMIVAWWKEGLGGAIAVSCLLAFYIVHFASVSRYPSGWAWLAFTLPGFLFLLDWYWKRKAYDAAA